MAQATSSGITYNQYFLIAALLVAVVTAVLAYNNGFFGGGTTNDVATPLSVDGSSSEGTSP
jgi:hypothetical protein